MGLLVHTHRWTAISATYTPDPTPTTRILRRCSCGDLGALTLEGRWHDVIAKLPQPWQPPYWDVFAVALPVLISADRFSRGQTTWGAIWAGAALLALALITWTWAGRKTRHRRAESLAARTRADERARITAHLRKVTDDDQGLDTGVRRFIDRHRRLQQDTSITAVLLAAADEIERGDHA